MKRRRRPRRWQPTEEELKRIDEVPRRPLLDLAHALVRRPALVAEGAKSVVQGAIQGIRSSPDIVWYLGNVRIERVAPELARGATWYGELPFLAMLRPLLGPSARALELGAGAGRISRHVAPTVRELVVTDPSAAMLDEARENLAELPNVRFVRTRGFTLPQFGDASFDVVYAHDVFEFFDGNQTLALLDETRRVLRPGGRCVVSFYALDNPLWAREQLEVARSSGRTGRFGALKIRPYAAAQMEALFRLAGLEVCDRFFGGETVPEGPTQRQVLATPEPADRAALNEQGRCILVGQAAAARG